MFNFGKKARMESRIFELEQELAKRTRMYTETSQNLRDTRDALKAVTAEFDAKSLPVNEKKLTRLVFTAMTPDGLKRSEWGLGLGPCGKVVEGFELDSTPDKLIIKQFHDDGSHKVFTYDQHDIVGRVQECYEVVDTKPGTYWHDRVKERIAFDRRLRIMGVRR